MKVQIDEAMLDGGINAEFVQRNAEEFAERLGQGSLRFVRHFDRVGKLRNVSQMIQFLLNPSAAYDHEKYRGKKEEKWEQFNKYQHFHEYVKLLRKIHFSAMIDHTFMAYHDGKAVAYGMTPYVGHNLPAGWNPEKCLMAPNMESLVAGIQKIWEKIIQLYSETYNKDMSNIKVIVLDGDHNLRMKDSAITIIFVYDEKAPDVSWCDKILNF